MNRVYNIMRVQIYPFFQQVAQIWTLFNFLQRPYRDEWHFVITKSHRDSRLCAILYYGLTWEADRRLLTANLVSRLTAPDKQDDTQNDE